MLFHHIPKLLTIGPRSIRKQAFFPIAKEERGLMWRVGKRLI